MSKIEQPASSEPPAALFDRVASILEQARGNVVRAVNTQMVLAYWLIGREIVQELQGGEERAEYGKRVLEELSNRLTEHYGKGFSATNLKYFRLFYQAYPERLGIRHPSGDESSGTAIPHPLGGESEIPSPLGRKLETDQKPCAPGVESSETSITHPMGAQFAISYPLEFELLQAFSPQLTWSHYRALMRVDNIEARDFYECEAIEGGWDKRTLERQIQTFYYERMLKSAKPGKMLAEGRNLPIPASSPCEVLKNPYVLEFLGLPDVADFHETDLERAIITHLQRFLLELGNGFAFVARQKQIRIGEQERYIDLVFYHCRQKFYLLIDLKVEELTHGDVGQMDGYVRMYDGLFTSPDDNPTIGLILCTEKNETVARYSVLSDRKQIFASKYMLCLPTEEQLRLEIERERRLIESNMEEQADV
jgi:predicted nuclease of restriction endonuclease-like (RecB) superfamily